MTGLSFTSEDLWERHRTACLKFLQKALDELEPGSADETEPELNRRLYFAIVAAQHEAARRGCEHVPVVPEGRNPPDPTSIGPHTSEYKIPDFYWAYVDHLAPAPEASARQFVVECKRLRVPTTSWDFYEQYVISGVLRFTSEAHGYGKGSPTGAMVGYLQGVPAQDAFDAVNRHAEREQVAPLVASTSNADDTLRHEHTLVRTFSDSPFLLEHFWAVVAP